MKKLFLALTFIALTTAGFISCSDDEENETPQPIENTSKQSTLEFNGEYNVQSSTGAFNDTIATSCELTNTESLNLTLVDVRFSQKMPKMTIVVPNISYTLVISSAGDSIISFESDSIIPTLNEKPYEKQPAKNISGKIQGDSIEFSISFGSIPTQYKGLKK